MKFKKDAHDIHPKNVPTYLTEIHRKTIWIWSFIFSHPFWHNMNFICFNVALQQAALERSIVLETNPSSFGLQEYLLQKKPFVKLNNMVLYLRMVRKNTSLRTKHLNGIFSLVGISHLMKFRNFTSIPLRHSCFVTTNKRIGMGIPTPKGMRVLFPISLRIGMCIPQTKLVLKCYPKEQQSTLSTWTFANSWILIW